jgi:hypothetical protein
MFLSEILHKRLSLSTDVDLDEILLKALNSSRFSESKDDIHFWKYFPFYKRLEVSQEMLYLSMDREAARNYLGYFHVLFADFIVYRDKTLKNKLKLSMNSDIIFFHFIVIIGCYFLTSYITGLNALFLAIGIYGLMEFFIYDINIKRMRIIKCFIEDKYRERYNNIEI